MQQKALKPKKCKVCGDEFYPFNSMQKVCGVKCSIEFAKKEKRKTFDRETRQLKRELNYNDRRYQLKKLQEEFNAYIRARDYGLPCISCGRERVEWTRGGEWDAGHFISRGAKPELRFEEKNCHKQCKSCNGGSGKHARKGYTVAQEYEERLRSRIGDEAVDWLKGPHKEKKYMLEEIHELRKHYRNKLREARGCNQQNS